MITTHPILRAMINLSSSQNAIHLEYILNAGLLQELFYILTTHKIPVSCRISLDIFTVQILSNLAAHSAYAYLIAETQLSQFVCQLLETNPDELELLKEVGIFIRNSVSHKEPFIIKKLIDSNVLSLLLQYTNTFERDEKALLPAMQAFYDIFTVGDQLVTPPTLNNLFVKMTDSYAGFESFLNVYLNATGKNIEDVMEHDEDIEDEESSNSPLTIKVQLASKTKIIMKKWFLNKFQETLDKAQMSQELFNRLGSLSVDTEAKKCCIMELVDEFSTLKPYQSNNNRTESEVTLTSTLS
jgi:hypothetical protein